MSTPPKLTLHHVNLVTDDVARAEAFYRDVMGLERPEGGLPRLEKRRGYAGDVAFLSDGAIQHHLAQKDVHAGFRAGQAVNPVSHGHIAYRTGDMDAFLAHLDAVGVPYSNWGEQAVQGWRQVFFYDPDGNVIEVHEVAPGAET
ncbi:VOC family protein [Roseibacterium sp. SDUM158016]|uniref:VOC family protein n=1 Tax=Roseicyclus sediminis TaxID=2980997 RepID=UPI0021CE241A|nr:VOC family protein [Roseibacterium sp. SDUM158016]MCU4655146.1 VOC family protein [Roseibacterium sp. SDUM158016]